MTKGSDLLVAALENEGVERIFGVPGEENLDVVESLRSSKIELVLTRHEQAAAFMAATHGRLTGKPGVCISTLGPGALNFTTGAAYAHLGAMPMVMLTGQKAIMTSRQARFQIVDVVASMKPLTKLARQIVSAPAIPTIVREAFRVATLRDQIASPARTILLVLLAAAAVVFVIACSNVANLILARSVRREGELAFGGSFSTCTGLYTGRTPRDKYIVDEPGTKDTVWWGGINQPVAPERFASLHQRLAAYTQVRHTSPLATRRASASLNACLAARSRE